MNPYYQDKYVTLHHGDCREVLASMAADSVDCVVTSPPYWGLRDYGLEPSVWDAVDGCEHEWGEEVGRLVSQADTAQHPGMGSPRHGNNKDVSQVSFCLRCGAWRSNLGLEPTLELFVQHLVEIFREVWRVLKSTGTLWLNMGDSYASGKGTCYNPGGGHDSLGQGRKQAGAHPLNRGNKSTLGQSSLKPKDLCGMPWRVVFALQADGWWLRSDIIWAKPNPMPESVRDRPTRSHEYLFLLTKAQRYYYDQEAVREPVASVSLKRAEYGWDCDRPSTKNASMGGDGIHVDKMGSRFVNPAGRNKRSVWTIVTQPYPEAHFATFPEKLVEPCVLAGTSEYGNCDRCGKPWVRETEKTGHVNKREPAHQPGNTPTKVDSTGWAPTSRATETWSPSCTCPAPVGLVKAVVCDPFAGSGTVGLVAKNLGRKAILIEASETYCALAVERVGTQGVLL